MSAESSSLQVAHAQLRLMGLEPLTPPLYFKDWRGNTQRIYSPRAEKKAALRAEVYRNANFACQGCGQQFDHADGYDGTRNIEGLTLGHIVDYRYGGPYEVPNLRAECRDCNLATAFMVPAGTPARRGGRLDGAYGESA